MIGSSQGDPAGIELGASAIAILEIPLNRHGSPMQQAAGNTTTFGHQLFGNQLWELVALVAKAAFFFMLTPLMVEVWGKSGYGIFAVAGSAFLFLGLLDFGVRPRLRVALSRAYRDGRSDTFRFIITEAIKAQSRITLPALALVLLLAAGGFWRSWLHIAEQGNLVIALTALFTVGYLLSSLFLEPLIVRGLLGRAKMAGALAALAAIPTVWVALWYRLSVAVALLTWFTCLIAGNLSGLLFSAVGKEELPNKPTSRTKPSFGLKEGWYFNAATLSWLSKTHLLTIVVAILGGYTEAGLFFVLLRVSEIISNFGAMSSDAAVAGLTQARGFGERRRRFVGVVGYAVFFSFQSTLAVGLLAPPCIEIWWRSTPFLARGTGVCLCLFGLSMALNRVVSSTAIGLGLASSVALWGMLDGAVGILVAIWLFPQIGLNGVLLGSSMGSLCLIPLIGITLTNISANPLLAMWIEVRRIAPCIVTSALLLSLGRLTGNFAALIITAGCAAGLSFVWILRRIRPSVTSERRLLPITQTASAPSIICRSTLTTR